MVNLLRCLPGDVVSSNHTHLAVWNLHLSCEQLVEVTNPSIHKVVVGKYLHNSWIQALGICVYLALGNRVLNGEICYLRSSLDGGSDYVVMIPKLHGICIVLCEPKPVAIGCSVVGTGGMELINQDWSPEIAITTNRRCGARREGGWCLYLGMAKDLVKTGEDLTT